MFIDVMPFAWNDNVIVREVCRYMYIALFLCIKKAFAAAVMAWALDYGSNFVAFFYREQLYILSPIYSTSW